MVLAIAALIGAACRSKPTPTTVVHADASQGCVVAADTLAAASPRVQCFVRAFQRRCDEGRQCMTRCAISAAGAGIGGGCWHLCYAYTGRELPNDPEFDRCPAFVPPPIPPEIPHHWTCDSAATGTRRLTGTILRDSTAEPIRFALLMPETSARVETQVDSAGNFMLADVPAGSARMRILSIGYTNRLVDVPPTGPFSCHVTIRRRRWLYTDWL